MLVCHNNVFLVDKPGKPDPPTIVKMTPKTCALSYKPPKDDGGAPIINYVIEYRVEGGFKWVQANVDEMVEETKYTVKVSTQARACIPP